MKHFISYIEKEDQFNFFRQKMILFKKQKIDLLRKIVKQLPVNVQ